LKMRLALVLTAAMSIGLSACGGGIPGFGGSTTVADPSVQPQGAGNTLRNFALYGGATVPESQKPQDDRDYKCPELEVLENGAGYRGNAGAGASASTYQASLTNRARECSYRGNQVVIRVGVEGRLLLGPNGKPGTYSVPVRIVVKRRQDIVTQRFARVSVTVPANDVQAEFSYIEENLTLPITENDPGDEYDILVGFDGSGAKPQKQARRR
jgi:hypothetical protein